MTTTTPSQAPAPTAAQPAAPQGGAYAELPEPIADTYWGGPEPAKRYGDQDMREHGNKQFNAGREFEAARLAGLRASHGQAPAGASMEALRHSANEWADMAANGLQWVRNIADGISDPKVALENLEANLKHCREVNDSPEVQAAVRAAAAPTAQPAPAATKGDSHG